MAELKTSIQGGVATVLFSNLPKMNAMTLDMWEAVPKVFAELDADPAVRLIVCAGDGEKAFISGADISQFEKLRGTVEAQIVYNKAVENAYMAPMNTTKPVIARIRGICIGGGLGFAAACDLRICSEDSVFRMPAARLGLGYSPAAGTTLLTKPMRSASFASNLRAEMKMSMVLAAPSTFMKRRTPAGL